MSSKRNEDTSLGLNNLSLRPLTQEGLNSFREDYRELEKEIRLQKRSEELTESVGYS